MQTHTHFRCVFDVSSADNLPNAWAALIGEIRAWISRKEKIDIKGWFFGGGHWNSQGRSRAQVEVKTFNEVNPPHTIWALRYDHLDSTVLARHWITNIGVTQVRDNEWRVAIHVLHGLRADYIGTRPEDPRGSSPNLVAALLNSERWLARAGSLRLRGKPEWIKVGKGDLFADLLQDPLRLAPIVLVSCERKTNKPKLDAGRLSAELAGTAVVYVCESPECDDELAYRIPFRFQSPNGTVRIYAPNADFKKEWTSTCHRFISANEIDSDGTDTACNNIVYALTRSDSWQGLTASVCTIEDIGTRIREYRLNALRRTHKRSMEERDELLELYDEEIEKQRQTIVTLQRRIENANGRLTDAEDKISRGEFDLEQANASAEYAKEEVRDLRRSTQAVTELVEWPASPPDLVEFSGRVFSDRLILTEKSRKSLAESKFIGCNDSTGILWRCLRAIANDLHQLLFGGGELSPVTIAERFTQETGFRLAWTETKQTKRHKRLVALRHMNYNGKQIDITPHVKWGKKPPRCLRVHFWVDQQRKQLVIGHCGDHLDTDGTRRRK